MVNGSSAMSEENNSSLGKGADPSFPCFEPFICVVVRGVKWFPNSDSGILDLILKSDSTSMRM